MKRLLLSLIISLNIITAQKPFVDNIWTQNSEAKINDIFGEPDREMPEDVHGVFNNSLFQHLNPVIIQRENWLFIGFVLQEWDGTQWVINVQYTYTYDANYNQTSYLRQTWDGTQWVNSRQVTNTYDANNNRTSYTRQDWDGTQWVNYYQYTRTYDANNNQTGDLRQDWDGTQWVNSYQSTRTYDANNNQTGYLYQNWDATQWVNVWQETRTYDANNNYTGILYQNWDATQWVNNVQYTYTYDANNNQTGYLYQNWDGTQWVNYYQYTNTYDANNNQILMLRQTWDGTQWVNDRQYTHTYDANNNYTDYLRQDWDGTQWVNYNQSTHAFDANNNKTSDLEQNWDGTQWVNNLQRTYTWVSSNPIIDTIPDQEIDEDQSLVLALSAQSPVSDALYVFSAYSDTSAVILDVISDTLHIVPATNWVGTALITVIVDPDNDASSDTIGFTLTVTPVNDSPEEFSVIYPTVSDTFSTHTNNDTLIYFRWGKSNDIDSDITYKLTIELEFFGNTYTDIHENITDTSISVSSNSLDNLLGGLDIDETEFHWYINALDEEYTVVSDTGEFVLSRAALGAVDGYAIPEQFSLHQNYPNPFNPVTTLRYDLPENALINITIYDMLGRQVKTLMDQTQDAGYRSIIWDATNDYGKPVSAGIYLYQIQAGEYISTKKMVLLK